MPVGVADGGRLNRFGVEKEVSMPHNQRHQWDGAHPRNLSLVVACLVLLGWLAAVVAVALLVRHQIDTNAQLYRECIQKHLPEMCLGL